MAILLLPYSKLTLKSCLVRFKNRESCSKIKPFANTDHHKEVYWLYMGVHQFCCFIQ